MGPGVRGFDKIGLSINKRDRTPASRLEGHGFVGIYYLSAGNQNGAVAKCDSHG
jgi:hypothetical protein